MVTPSNSFDLDNNDFAVALYQKVRSREGNVFFSPFSVRAVLAMALAGARGETAEQMVKALRISSATDAIHGEIAAFISQFEKNERGSDTARIANAIWVQQGMALQPTFEQLMANYYRGSLNIVDFRDPKPASAAINHWVKNATNARLPDLIPPQGLSPDARLVLVNSVLFKGSWMQRFRVEQTIDAPFHLQDGRTITARQMRQTRVVGYWQTNGYQVAELDYLGGTVSMLIFLPEEGLELSAFETRFSARMIRDSTSLMMKRTVRLGIPRFKFTWGTISLARPLVDLGMNKPFSESADFSGINDRRPPSVEALRLSDVLHAAFVEVNEEGTEATVATAAPLLVGSSLKRKPEFPVFQANRPFLFAIRHRPTEALLFLGRVSNPTP
jgi:serpin B